MHSHKAIISLPQSPNPNTKRMNRLSSFAMAFACAAIAALTPVCAVTVKDYVVGLPSNNNIGRISTNSLKIPGTNSLPSGAYISGDVINVTGSNVTLEDWDFDGYTVAVKAANCTIRNCILGEYTGVSGRWTYLDIWTDGNGLLVEHNDFLGFAGEGGSSTQINHRPGGSGATVYAAENIIIRYNKFDNMQTDAIKTAGAGAIIEWNAFLDPHNLNAVPQPYNSSTVYDTGENATNGDGTIFRSKIDNNTFAIPENQTYNWKSSKTYYEGEAVRNTNGIVFLSKHGNNLGNPAPSTATSDSHWQLYDHWEWYDPHVDHITMTAAPDSLTIQYNYLSRADRSRLVTGMNNALRLSRNTGTDHLVEEVVVKGNYIEENPFLQSLPVHINVGATNFNGPFILSHGWYGKNTNGSYIYPLDSGVTAYWDTNRDVETDAIIAAPANFISQSTTPPSTSIVPAIIVSGHGGASELGVTISAADFDAESHPGNENQIRIVGDHIGWINDGNWVRFNDFNFGSGASSCTVEASSGGAGGRIEFRLGSVTGTLIGYIDVTANGNWNDYRTFTTNSITNEFNADLYLVFERTDTSSADLMNLKSIRFEPSSDVGTTISATLFDAESHPGNDNQIRIVGEHIGWINGGNWVRFNDFDFGSGASSCTVEAASGGAGGRIEFRLGSVTGTLIGHIDVTANGDWTDFRTFSTSSITNESNDDLYLVFERINTSTADLMNLKSFKFE